MAGNIPGLETQKAPNKLTKGSEDEDHFVPCAREISNAKPPNPQTRGLKRQTAVASSARGAIVVKGARARRQWSKLRRLLLEYGGTAYLFGREIFCESVLSVVCLLACRIFCTSVIEIALSCGVVEVDYIWPHGLRRRWPVS